MHRRVPRGGGHVVPDAAYPAGADRDAIARGGRDPVTCPRRNPKPGGCHAMGKMPRGHRDDPEGFDRAYHRRSPAGTAFSATGEGSGAVARAGTPAVRKLRPVPKCVRCDPVAQTLPPERRATAPGGRCAQTTGCGAESGSLPCQPHGSARISASSHARVHQNVDKSEAENSELDSADALLVRSGVSSLFGSCPQLDTQAW